MDKNILSYTTLSLRKIKDILADKLYINIGFRSACSILENLDTVSSQTRKCSGFVRPILTGMSSMNE